MGAGEMIDRLIGLKTPILVGAVAIAISLPLGYCTGYDAAETKADAQRALANVEASQLQNENNEIAAGEAMEDAFAVAKREEELTDAIAQIPDSVPDAVRVQLGCERLLRQGTASADLPSPCGPSGSR